MIYCGPYSEKKYHHGLLVSISQSTPEWCNIDHHLNFFKPTWSMVRGNPSWEEYKTLYRELMRERWGEVKDWLTSLSRFRPFPEMTLLCWKKGDAPCHGSLVAKLIQRHRPDVWGGCNVPQLAAGDRVEWPNVPPYLDGFNLSPYEVRSIEGDMARISMIYHPVPLAELRLAPLKA